jgi:TolB-like protein
MPLASGSRLGSYMIVAPLGTGGMGEVYRAHDPRLGRDVALKVLPAGMATDPSRLERFTREARAIAALNHPHIVTIYSTEDADGIRFLTMELVEGQPLDALIPADGMPLARFLELALPLADALNAAHQKQITHRDLKPANVMVASDGRLKVLDFGLASVSTTNRAGDVHPAELVTSPQVTTPGTIIGTMPYMSPEQVEGRQLDHRTDLFSLGVMFHEMLVGTRPFGGESSPQLMSSILRDTPSSTSDLRTDVPEALGRLIARCLEKQPDDRVQTARDIYNELRHVQKQLESGPRPKPASGSARAVRHDSVWLAVLPFTSAASDEDSRTLADGLTEDITAGLARFPYLSVVAEHSARQHKGTTADVREIGKALGARYILDGGIRRGGSSIRITARLVDAGSGAQLWSETYMRELAQGNLLAVQDDLTDRVVATVADVHGVLLRSASVGLRGIPIDQLTPEELRLRYWSYHRQHGRIEHGLLREHFERLVEEQPAFAPFWAVLAHLCLHEYGFGFNARPEPLLRARRAVDRALELDSLNQHAWEALAFTLFFEQDREGFAHAVDRVLALNPRNANAVALLGILFVHTGELERGCALADRAITINPDHPGWYHIARASADYAAGQFESALRAAKRINMPQHLWAHALVAMASAQVGRTAEALAALETLLVLEPGFAEEAVMAAAARRWKWLPEQAAQMVDGYRKAMALRRDVAGARPPSDAATAPVAAAMTSASPGAANVAGRAPSPFGTRPPSDAQPGAFDMSVAVRPFTVRAGDDDAAELAEGLIENITTGLSRFAYLRVRGAPVAGDHARQAAGVSTPTSGARFVVDGGVRRSGRAVRVNVRLLEVASGTTLWAEHYDRDGSVDPFTIQDEIGDSVAATLADDGGVLYRLLAAAVRTSTDEEHDALRLFVRFAEFVEHFTREQHSRLRDEYQALVERQPSNATAWAHLAILYGLEVFFDFNPLPDAVTRVRRAAERAVAIDSTHQGAWYALADAAFFERNAAAFRAAADRAIELNPLRSRTLGAIGLLRAFAGDPPAGAVLVTRAISLNPRHPDWFHLALFLDAFQRGDADRALGEAAQINMPHVPVDGRLFAIAAAGRFGRAPEAAAAINELRRDYPHLLDARRAREAWAIRIWDGELLDSLVDGFEAALKAQSFTSEG